MAAIGKEGYGKRKQKKVERVPLPEAGEDAYAGVREMSAKDLRDLRRMQGAEGDLGELGFVYELLARSLCDDEGELVFASAAELAETFDLPASTFTRLGREACRISGLAVAEKN